MRRGKQPDPQARRAIDAFQHGARGTFAISAGNVDEAQAVLRIIRQARDPAGAVQPQPGAEHSQAIQEFHCLSVSHLSVVIPEAVLISVSLLASIPRCPDALNFGVVSPEADVTVVSLKRQQPAAFVIASMPNDNPEPSTGDDLLKNSTLYKEFQAEREEILKHKWIESEKVGHDIGFERALTDWIVRHRSKWRKARQTTQAASH